jgi:chemotaxis protein histidine kinase CheA
MSQSSNFDEEFAALRDQFLNGLIGRWNTLSSTESLDVFATELHRLAGAAGLFGFLPVSELAKDAEAQLLQDAPVELQNKMNLLRLGVEEIVATKLRTRLVPVEVSRIQFKDNRRRHIDPGPSWDATLKTTDYGPESKQ